jgi:beta-lactamase class A
VQKRTGNRVQLEEACMTNEATERIPTIGEAIASFSGTIGIAARKFGAGDEMYHNSDVIFPTASTFKTVLLYELFRQADAGRVDLAERFTIEDRHRVPGSGVIQDFDSGAVLTIRDIATLMISVSDNAGTDIIFNLLGSEAIAGAVRDLGMSDTSLPLPTWGLLAGLLNIDPNDRSITYEDLKEQLRTGEIDWDCNALRESPDNDITTPRDMLELHQAIFDGAGLSEAGKNGVLDVLKRQKMTERIPAYLPRGTVVANKTGSLKGVRNDAGIVFAMDSTTYGLAIFTKGAENEVAATRLVADISKLIYEYYVGPIH